MNARNYIGQRYGRARETDYNEGERNMNDGSKENTDLAIHEPTNQLAPMGDELASMPTSLRLYLDDRLYERVSAIALRMSKATGITPKHLIGQSEACFAVVSMAITWRLDPYRVGAATFQTPGGQIGFEGKLVQAIIESSGKLEPASGGVHYEHYGDWSKVQGRFEIKESKKLDDNGNPKKYTAPTWTDNDARAGKPADQTTYPVAQSCGVRVIAHIRGEKKPRHLDFDLIQAQPRNSTLWATDPMTQICYTAVRRFGSAVVPSLIMGVPFDPQDNMPPAGPIDITAQGSAEVSGPRSKSETAQASAEVAAPRSKSETAQASSTRTEVDTETGEIREKQTAVSTTNAKAATNGAEPQTPAATASTPREGTGVAASAGMLKHIRALLDKNTLSDAEMAKCVGVQKLDGIDVATANQVLKWIADPGGYNKAA